MINLKAKQNQIVFSDAGIQAEIRQNVRMHPEFCASDLDDFSVSVKDRVVLFTGHVSDEYHRELIKNIAYAIPVINTVHSDMIVDSDLASVVSKRLCKDERTRHLHLPVGCSYGWIRLGGEVSTREEQIAAEEVAGQSPFVRGILAIPRVMGEGPCPERRTIQPRVTAQVYTDNSHVGIVTQVVVHPRNRLVTHVIVSDYEYKDGGFVFRDYLISVDEIEAAHNEKILLRCNCQPLSAFPSSFLADFPLAPLSWQPPYPYVPGDIRWPREQHEDSENGSSAGQLFRMRE